jgi:alkylated DNA repair dioxygenase AlkB
MILISFGNLAYIRNKFSRNSIFTCVLVHSYSFDDALGEHADEIEANGG